MMNTGANIMTNKEIKQDVRAYMGEDYNNESMQPLREFLENMLTEYEEAMQRVKKGKA